MTLFELSFSQDGLWHIDFFKINQISLLHVMPKTCSAVTLQLNHLVNSVTLQQQSAFRLP